jgi:pimeloyl-ACP methyl ester carboxylesterase
MNTRTERETCLISTADAPLQGFLEVPANAAGLVVFAHGSGSSRFSRRNNAVAAYLREAGLGTLLFDLLTADEDRIDAVTREFRFDIPLLCRRLAGSVGWLRRQPALGTLPIGLFGSSTGAAAALVVAARLPESIQAVVSRGGRADLAGDYLQKVRAPTLLIVGGKDPEVLRLNRAALDAIPGGAELAVVEGATHLFEEPGALQEVEELARRWFLRHLRGKPGAGAG